ncbi:hypothetical protein PR048_025519 [Dryococelus australis]|uniref:Uncharacterized protein n=1 Tax=Dryococelus australis TaxID=614101 RepID=A0ABQ9GRK1_9NEOP|nr:hypothetical protein PR048_025519 [Dryococelus australis]
MKPRYEKYDSSLGMVSFNLKRRDPQNIAALPDLSPTEYVWGAIDFSITTPHTYFSITTPHTYYNIRRNCEFIETARDRSPQETIRDLYKSMSRRLHPQLCLSPISSRPGDHSYLIAARFDPWIPSCGQIPRLLYMMLGYGERQSHLLESSILVGITTEKDAACHTVAPGIPVASCNPPWFLVGSGGSRLPEFGEAGPGIDVEASSHLQPGWDQRSGYPFPARLSFSPCAVIGPKQTNAELGNDRGGGNRRSPRKLADTRHRPCKIPKCENPWTDPARNLTRIALVGGDRSSHSNTMDPLFSGFSHFPTLHSRCCSPHAILHRVAR